MELTVDDIVAAKYTDTRLAHPTTLSIKIDLITTLSAVLPLDGLFTKISGFGDGALGELPPPPRLANDNTGLLLGEISEEVEEEEEEGCDSAIILFLR